MNRLISLALPESFEMYQGADGQPLPALEPLSRINIFVGSNNSGKSRFMRLLSIQNNYQGIPVEYDNEEASKSLFEALAIVKSTFDKYGIIEAGGFSAERINQLQKLPPALNLGVDVYQEYRDVFGKLATVQRFSSWSGTGNATNPRFAEMVRDSSKRVLDVLEGIPRPDGNENPQKVYIPIFRGLRTIDQAGNDIYQTRTVQDYFSEEGVTPPEIFTGLSFFQRLTDLLLGSNAERKTISQYQKFTSETLFEGRSITLIPNQKSNVVMVKIGKEQDRPIHLLGDGIQAAIILSFLPFIT